MSPPPLKTKVSVTSQQPDVNENESFELFKQILPGQFRIFGKLLHERVKAEEVKAEDDVKAVKAATADATSICNIIGKLYDVIVTDCRQVTVSRSQKSLHRFKVKNLVKALVEMLESSKTLRDMLDTFESEYGLKDLRCTPSEGQESDDLPAPLSQYLAKCRDKYGWTDQPLVNHLTRWCASKCDSVTKTEIEGLVNDIIREISCVEEDAKCCKDPLTPYKMLDYLMDKFI